MKAVDYIDAGTIGYEQCWKLQQELFDALIEAKQSGLPGRQAVILCEHPHVYTLGRSGNAGNLLIDDVFLSKIGATYHRTDRGGDITYHGPGQLVGYPILDLDELGLGLKEYIHTVEQAVIHTLADYGVRAGRSEGATGVWLEADENGPLRKICAIGVRSSHFVTMHGFALNVDPAMEYFSYINPCGFIDRGVTSLSKETGRESDMAEVKERFLSHFGKIINVKINKIHYADCKEMGP